MDSLLHLNVTEPKSSLTEDKLYLRSIFQLQDPLHCFPKEQNDY